MCFLLRALNLAYMTGLSSLPQSSKRYFRRSCAQDQPVDTVRSLLVSTSGGHATP
uniref:Uncharacterized protein n=1 Tax=Utricularia reniformis TaxID=192314 RepID=A0A1Y0B0D7_9LAMI|nr:hypothetical protein AEK19_MT0588 [Utricularia reniformis]ART30844.1 hypothetical protein AEK19_MT0588 [Utricularia reniformis]